MSKCPKCGRKLHLWNVSQFCPECNCNMRFYGFAENFYKEAKYAELTNAVVHVKIRRLKAALIGSPLNIARLVVSLLPLLSLLVPAAKITMTLPYRTSDISLSALGLYEMFTGGEFGYIGSIKDISVWSDAFTAVNNALFAYLPIAVLAVAVLLMSILCFCSIKNMQKIIAITSLAGIPAAGVSFWFISGLSAKCGSSPVLSASASFGLIVSAAAFIVVAAINFILDKKGIHPEYDEGQEERVALYRKLKKGEFDIDAAQYPLVETAATREIQEKIAKERKEIEEKREEEK